MCARPMQVCDATECYVFHVIADDTGKSRRGRLLARAVVCCGRDAPS